MDGEILSADFADLRRLVEGEILGLWGEFLKR